MGSNESFWWAKKVAYRSGIVPVSRNQKGRSALDKNQLIAANSGDRDPSKSRFRSNARAVREVLRREGAALGALREWKTKAALNAVLLKAQIEGEPFSEDKAGEFWIDQLFSPAIQKVRELGIESTAGIRKSRKRKTFSEVQQAINGLQGFSEIAANTGKRVTRVEVARRLGVSHSTLWRWMNEGHLRKAKFNWGANSASADLKKTVLHELKEDETDPDSATDD